MASSVTCLRRYVSSELGVMLSDVVHALLRALESRINHLRFCRIPDALILAAA
jgi:hypothetical protein